MTPNSAYTMIDIVQDTDYTPGDTTENVGGVAVINGKEPPVYGLFCTATNTSPVVMQALGMNGTISVPTGSFKQGVIYYIYLKKITDLGGATFIGFKYANHPLVY